MRGEAYPCPYVKQFLGGFQAALRHTPALLDGYGRSMAEVRLHQQQRLRIDVEGGSYQHRHLGIQSPLAIEHLVQIARHPQPAARGRMEAYRRPEKGDLEGDDRRGGAADQESIRQRFCRAGTRGVLQGAVVSRQRHRLAQVDAAPGGAASFPVATPRQQRRAPVRRLLLFFSVCDWRL